MPTFALMFIFHLWSIFFPSRCLYFRTQLRAQQRTSLTVSSFVIQSFANRLELKLKKATIEKSRWFKYAFNFVNRWRVTLSARLEWLKLCRHTEEVVELGQWTVAAVNAGSLEPMSKCPQNLPVLFHPQLFSTRKPVQRRPCKRQLPGQR